jgi:hypothetical protein
MSSSVTLRTPFKIQNFESIEDFIMTIFPDLESYLQKQLIKGIKKADLATLVYSELERNLKLFIVKNYTKDLDNYIQREAKHVSKEVMKDTLLSTISITLNVSDESSRKLSQNDYLFSLRKIINNTKL